MSRENETFRKAARNAGINGKDWHDNDALKNFSSYYHDKWNKWEREQDGYDGILTKAKQWWKENKHKYS